MQDPSSSRSALPVLPPAQTKPVLPQGIHPARPPPQGHKNPALIFPVHAGRFLLKSSCPHGFHPYLLIPALRRKFVFRSLHLFFNCQMRSIIFDRHRQFRFTVNFSVFYHKFPACAVQQIALWRCCLLIVPDTVQKSRQLNFSICIRLFVSSKLPSFVQI